VAAGLVLGAERQLLEVLAEIDLILRGEVVTVVTVVMVKTNQGELRRPDKKHLNRPEIKTKEHCLLEWYYRPNCHDCHRERLRNRSVLHA
jgi:hypothetical protein